MRETRVGRAITSRSDDERGFTLVEVLVTMVILGVLTAAALALLFRAYTDTGIVESRRDVLGDARIALEQLSKQIRQATVVHTQTSTQLDIETYLDGANHRVVWSASSGACPCTLSRTVDGGSPAVILETLQDTDVFAYTTLDGVLHQVTLKLAVGTKPTTTVEITSDVETRNLR